MLTGVNAVNSVNRDVNMDNMDRMMDSMDNNHRHKCPSFVDSIEMTKNSIMLTVLKLK